MDKNLETLLQNLQTSINDLAKETRDVKQTVHEMQLTIQKEIGGISTANALLKNDVEAHKEKIRGLEAELKEMKEKVEKESSKNTSDDNRIKDLQAQIKDLKDHSAQGADRKFQWYITIGGTVAATVISYLVSSVLK